MTTSRAIFFAAALLMACGSEPAKEVYHGPNRPPAFVQNDTLLITRQVERDVHGIVIGAVTTLELRQGAKDPDGDSVTYTWEGVRFNGDTLVPAQIAAGQLTMKFRSGVMMNEPAGGIMKVTASDPQGLKAVKEICVSGGGFKC